MTEASERGGSPGRLSWPGLARARVRVRAFERAPAPVSGGGGWLGSLAPNAVVPPTWVRRPVGGRACEGRTLHFLLTLAVFP